MTSKTSSIVVGSMAKANFTLSSTCMAPNRMPDTLCTSGSSAIAAATSGLNPMLVKPPEELTM